MPTQSKKYYYYFLMRKEPMKAKCLRPTKVMMWPWEGHCGPLQDAVSHASCSEELASLH